MNKVLILVPNTKLLGGVANYYFSLRPFLPDNFRYFIRGSRGFQNKTLRLLILVSDLFKFILQSSLFNPHVIVINSSIGNDGLKRDAIFLKLAKLFRKKIIVFFRGWESSFFVEREIPFWFRNTFLKCDRIIVLSNEFRKQLIDVGFLGEIIVETTTVDERLLSHNSEILRSASSFSILFLSRVENDKGIYDAIKALKILQSGGQDVSMNVAGEGSELINVKAFVESEGIKNVFFHGFVKDKAKARLFRTSSVYLFPSFHGEGMPNSVLEAMAYGLPVLTTRVGGVADFFIDSKMGFFIESQNPEDICLKIKILLSSPHILNDIKTFNSKYAENTFYSNKVAKRLIKHFEFE